MSDPSTTGSVRFWDYEDCPCDDCEGDLQQQDRFNVQCLSCESVFTHCRRSDRHWLEDHIGEIVAQKTLVTDGGGDQPQRARTAMGFGNMGAGAVVGGVAAWASYPWIAVCAGIFTIAVGLLMRESDGFWSLIGGGRDV